LITKIKKKLKQPLKSSWIFTYQSFPQKANIYPIEKAILKLSEIVVSELAKREQVYLILDGPRKVGKSIFLQAIKEEGAFGLSKEEIKIYDDQSPQPQEDRSIRLIIICGVDSAKSYKEKGNIFVGMVADENIRKEIIQKETGIKFEKLPLVTQTILSEMPTTSLEEFHLIINNNISPSVSVKKIKEFFTSNNKSSSSLNSDFIFENISESSSSIHKKLEEIIKEIEKVNELLSQVKEGVSVFGSARETQGDYYKLAVKLGAIISKDFWIITGGGPGLMRAVCESASKTVGLKMELPFKDKENYANLNLLFHYFFARKLGFASVSKGFIALPGGFGTLDELFEILNLKKQRFLDKM
jgi:uncharacterized protein (TIGR00725 family)